MRSLHLRVGRVRGLRVGNDRRRATYRRVQAALAKAVPKGRVTHLPDQEMFVLSDDGRRGA